MIQTTSRTQHEEIKHDGFRVSTLDWVAYPILNMREVPHVDSVLVNRLSVPPGRGMGEASAVPTTAAIGNAIFDATGARLRQVPFRPERILEALKNG